MIFCLKFSGNFIHKFLHSYFILIPAADQFSSCKFSLVHAGYYVLLLICCSDIDFKIIYFEVQMNWILSLYLCSSFYSLNFVKFHWIIFCIHFTTILDYCNLNWLNWVYTSWGWFPDLIQFTSMNSHFSWSQFDSAGFLTVPTCFHSNALKRHFWTSHSTFLYFSNNDFYVA